MLSRNLLAGISVLAFAAGAANAQQANINDEFVRGNGTSESNCTPEGTAGNEGNLCTIDIDGVDDDSADNGETDVQGASGNYADSDFRGDFNVTTIDIFGDDNSATINIRDNTGETGQGTGDADNNWAMITIGSGTGTGTGVDSEDNSASIVQRGDSNSSTIMVGGSEGSYDNAASSYQDGDENTSAITQDGDNNSAIAYQVNDESIANAGFNVSTITQSGSGNSASNYQYLTDDYDYSASNVATISQDGTGNAATNRQDTFSYFDDSNEASITQLGSYNTALNEQYGEGNDAEVDQDGLYNTSLAAQYGYDNMADVTQSGESNSSIVTQGFYSYSGSTTVSVISSDNTATVTMNGANMTSVVEQNTDSSGSSNMAMVQLSNNLNYPSNFQGNVSIIDQQTSGNTAWVVISGGEGVGLDGSPQSGPNSSSISQYGGNGNEAGVFIGAGTRVVEGESQDARNPDLNQSVIDQNGWHNYAEVTMETGTTDVDIRSSNPSFGQTGGNSSTIAQTGDGSSAVVTVSRSGRFFGIGNSVSITQTESTGNYTNQDGTLFNRSTEANQMGGSGTTDRPSYREFGSASRNFTGANGHYAETWHFGRYDDVSITQQDDAGASVGSSSASGRVYDDGSISRARAGVYTGGANSSVTLTQTGDNYAEISQGQASEENTTFFGQSRANVTQVDAGDVVTSEQRDGGQTCSQNVCVDNPDITVYSYGRQYNQAIVTQLGDFNQIDATQNTRNGYASLWQQVGTEDNRIVVEQGTGSSDVINGFAGPNGVYTDNPIGANAPEGFNTQNLTAVVTQGGEDNAARVLQDGTNLTATVTQMGNGDDRTNATDFQGFGATVGNQVLVFQQGSNNRATATQTSGVGRSTVNDPASGNSQAQNVALTQDQNAQQDEFYFSGGARSAEIDILQSGSGNTALVEQRGRGQYARVDQGPANGTGGGGNNNLASILQMSGATNATAVITQRGSNNSYYVIQDLPGQYIAVEQNGNGNASSNVVQRGNVSQTSYNSPFAPPPAP